MDTATTATAASNITPEAIAGTIGALYTVASFVIRMIPTPKGTEALNWFQRFMYAMDKAVTHSNRTTSDDQSKP